MVQTRQTFEEIALADPDRHWELHDGLLREKPGMSIEHNDVMAELARWLGNQLDRMEYRVRSNSARLRVSGGVYYIPDVVVIPAEMERALRGRPGRLEVYVEPVPLVVEIWSPSTGAYDIGEKLAGYQQRGDREIWRLHPYERTLIAWRRQPDGSYVEMTYEGGTVEPVALAGVVVDLDALFN